MSAIYYDQESEIKSNQSKTIVTFDNIPESKILDAGNILILLNLQKLWTIACKDVSRVFEIKYSINNGLYWTYIYVASCRTPGTLCVLLSHKSRHLWLF